MLKIINRANKRSPESKSSAFISITIGKNFKAFDIAINVFYKNSMFCKRRIKGTFHICQLMIFCSFYWNKTIKMNIKNAGISLICDDKSSFRHKNSAVLKKLKIMCFSA